MSACAFWQAISPITHPIPIAITGDTPIASGIPSSTSIPVCNCPTNIVTIAQSEGGGISHSPVICNCPAIIIQPPIPGPWVEITPQTIPTNDITLADNGKTYILHPGESFLLNLGTDVYEWVVDIDNQNVLSRVKNIIVIRGTQGMYEVNSLGQAVLTAIGNPFCRNLIPACMLPSILFNITVIVQ
jgi:hypothetical protein